MHILIVSKPKGTCTLEQWDEGAIDMASHECLDTTQELAAHEHGWKRLLALHGELVQDRFDIVAAGTNPAGVELVQLDDGWPHTKAEEQPLGHRAHAAAAHAEQDHCVPAREPPDHFVRRIELHSRRPHD